MPQRIVGYGFSQVPTNGMLGGMAYQDPINVSVNNISVGSGSLTGTASQPLQVTGGAYVSGNLGIGITNPSSPLTLKTVSNSYFPAIKVEDYTETTGVYIQSVSGGNYRGIGANGRYYNSGLYRSDSTVASLINLSQGLVRFYTNSGLTADADYTPTERVRIDTNGCMGIGMSPDNQAYRLQIYNSSQDVAYLSIGNNVSGSGSLNGLVVGINQNDAYFLNRENGPIYFWTNNTERARIDSSGNLWIGKTTEASLTPISAKAVIRSTTANVLSLESSVAGGAVNLDFDGQASNGLQSGPRVRLTQGHVTSWDSYFAISLGGGGVLNERLRLDSSGNLGLGVVPSAWVSSAKALQLPNSCSLSSSVNGYLSLNVNAYEYGADAYRYLVSGLGASRYQVNYGLHQWYVAPSGTAGATSTVTSGQVYTVTTLGNTSLAQWQALFSALTVLPTVGQSITATSTGTIGGSSPATVTQTITFTQAMTLDASGRLMVGTTTQQGMLTVYGITNTTYGTFDAASTGYAYHTYKTAGSVYGYIGQGSALVTGGGASDFGILAETGNILFGSSTTQRAVITSSGNLGINQTSPSGRLHVTSPAITASAPSLGWPVYNAETDANSKSIYIDTAGNGSVGTASSGPTVSLVLGSYYDSRVVITPIGAGGASPSDQSVGSGKDLLIKGGTSDNNVKLGGRLYLSGGSGWSVGPGFNSNYGAVIIQPFGGNLGVGTANPTARLVVDGGGVNNIALRDDCIENHKVNGDTAGIAINYLGYNSTTSNFRNFLIYNGKQGEIARFTGSTGAFSLTGQFQSTQANNTANGGGQIYLNGANGNRIDFNTNGVAAPAFTTRSNGTKIVLYPQLDGTNVDYAFGIEGSTLWSSVPTTSQQFKWYGGTTNIATLTGGGSLSVIGTISATTGTFSANLSVDTSGTSASTSTVVFKRSGQSIVNFGSYSGSWRTALQLQNNDNTRLLFIAPPENDYAYGIIRSANGGLKIDVGGTTASSGTNALTIETNGNSAFSSNLVVTGTANALDPSNITSFGAGQITESSTGFSAPGIVFGSSVGQHGAIVYGSNTMYFGTETGSDNTMNTRMTLSSGGNLSATGTVSGTNITSGGNVTGSSASCTGNAATATNISNSGTVTLATATESNSIYITAPSYTTDQPVKLLNFDWYGNTWSFGNIRSGATPSNGLGVYSSGTERARFTTSGMSIAGDGSTLYGPNSTWSRYLRVGGNGNADTTNASVVTTDGNLHLDARTGSFGTYINFYKGTGGVYFGNGASGTVGYITSSGNLTLSGTVSGTNITSGGNVTGSSASCTGNAATATTLQTTRTINNVSFNGSANIVVPTIFDSNYYSIINPGGAQYVTTTATLTGAIAITLPVGMTNTMLRMTIRVYEYTTNESFDIYCGGYAYNAGNTWANNPFAYIVGYPDIDRRFNVRFGYTAAGRAIIYIGELASTWSYPQVYVTEVQLGYSGFTSTYSSGWSISFVSAAFENVTATISDCQVGYRASTNTAKSLVYRDASGNFSAGTITATTFSGSGASLTSIPNSALVNSTISGVSLGSNLGTLTLNTSGTGLSGSTTYNGSGAATFTVTSNATSANTASAIVARDASGNFSAGTITATTFSGSGGSLTGLPAAQLSGTIPSGVLGNSAHFIGTTSIALNRASAAQTLTGVSIDGNAATATSASQIVTSSPATPYTATVYYPTFVTATSPASVQYVTEFNFQPSSGNLTVPGNVVISTSGKGIDFSATANSSGTMTSELFSDYEEGTFSPVFVGSSMTFSYSQQSGRYTKIGRNVTLDIFVALNASGNTFNSNTISIQNLPFAPNNSVYTYTGGAHFSGLATSIIAIPIKTDTNAIFLYKQTAAATNSTTRLIGTDLANSCWIALNITFTV